MVALDFFCYCYCYSNLANTPIQRMTHSGRSGGIYELGLTCAPPQRWILRKTSVSLCSMAQSVMQKPDQLHPTGRREGPSSWERSRKKLNVQASHEELTGLLVGETHKAGKLIQCHCLFSTCGFLPSFCPSAVILNTSVAVLCMLCLCLCLCLYPYHLDWPISIYPSLYLSHL